MQDLYLIIINTEEYKIKKGFYERQRKQKWLRLLDRKRWLVFQIFTIIIIIIIKSSYLDIFPYVLPFALIAHRQLTMVRETERWKGYPKYLVIFLNICEWLMKYRVFMRSTRETRNTRRRDLSPWRLDYRSYF